MFSERVTSGQRHEGEEKDVLNVKSIIKNTRLGAGEIAQWLRTFVALPEDVGSNASTQVRRLTIPCNVA